MTRILPAAGLVLVERLAKSAIPALEAALEDESDAVRHAANRALDKIRGT